MLLATDVAYQDGPETDTTSARAAAVSFEAWEAPTAAETWVTHHDAVAPYVPGEFYRRELPCIWPLVIEAGRRAPLEVVIVDGFVELGPARLGLGAHLYARMRAEGWGAAVVGVAKNDFRGSNAVPVFRGDSHTPLFVTAAGLPVAEAAAAVARMHGPYRLPTLLRYVDQLAGGVAT